MTHVNQTDKEESVKEQSRLVSARTGQSCQPQRTRVEATQKPDRAGSRCQHYTHRGNLTAKTSAWRPAARFFSSSPWASFELSSSFSCSTCHDIVILFRVCVSFRFLCFWARAVTGKQSLTDTTNLCPSFLFKGPCTSISQGYLIRSEMSLSA